ncbi:MAG: hypothetical protein GY847_14045 [Proteobacteria bacterium]|nr:hypothetical protein [Pseudomonadota bacterium]
MKKKMRKIQSLIIVGLSIFIPGLAYADAGLPMLIIIMPAFGIAFIPIVVIEAVYLSKKLKIAGRSAVLASSVSNIVSTVFGVPLTWLLLVGIEIATGAGNVPDFDDVWSKVLSVTLQAPWLPPYGQHLDWMIPTAASVLLVPFFFVSWWSEYLVSKLFFRAVERLLLRRIIRNANLITYGLLLLSSLTMLVVSNL